MSNNNNEMVKEQILAEVQQMQTSCILRELDGGISKPGMCDSFDERVATVDRDVITNRLVEMRFEKMEVLHG
mgnify:CR=1 FL=1|tara:strand:+ start:235 stop:450 length:216 start_codon:yes stop_codon:yes gene_type:complete